MVIRVAISRVTVLITHIKGLFTPLITTHESPSSRGTLIIPKGPCTQIVYTLVPMYLYREYFKAKVYTIWVHGPLGYLLFKNSTA